MVALPLVFLGSALAVDVTRLIVTARQVSNATEAAAVAGAQQFRRTPVTPCPTATCYQYSLDLNQGASDRVARETMREAVRWRAVTASTRPGDTSVRIFDNPSGTERVEVTVNYRVTGLTFVPVVNYLLGETASRDVSLTAVRYADVCASRDVNAATKRYAPTEGNCTRPTGAVLGY